MRAERLVGERSRRGITAGILLALGVGFTLWSAQLVATAHAVRAWPTAEGLVTESELLSAHEPHDLTTPMYTASITYTYTVGSRGYAASRVTFADHSSSRPAGMAAVVARYPLGSSVSVHYDPAEPASAVLETPTPLPVYGPLLLGLLAALSGGVALVRALIPRAQLSTG
jgi:hypothetical protein